MGKIVRSHVEKKIDELKGTLDKFLESNKPDKKLIEANTKMLQEKEDLEERYEILTEKELNLRRELSKANTELKDLREKNKTLEAELKAFRSSVKMIEDLKDNLERGLVKLSPDNVKYIAD